MISINKFVKRSVPAFFVFTCLSSCSSDDNKIEEIVERAYKQCKPNASCIIDFKQSTDFSWDTMHVLGTGVEDALANELLGFDYEKFKDFNRLILFVKGKKVIYEESYVAGFSGDNPSRIYFDEQTVTDISASNSKFTVELNEGVYVLSRLK